MSADWQRAFQIGSRTFNALMLDTLRCDCDQGGVPLCVQCECLFRLAVAATDFAYTVGRQQRNRQTLTETDVAWARGAIVRQGWQREEPSDG